MKKIFIILVVSLGAVSVFGKGKEIVECRIWKPESFCTLPHNVNPPGGVSYSTAYTHGISCKELDTNNLVCVWITFKGKNVSEINLESQYKNIKLIRKNHTKILHPIAYLERKKPIHKDDSPLVENLPQYLSNISTFAKCTYHIIPKMKYDLFILFETAEVGDKLVIEGFLEVEIK